MLTFIFTDRIVSPEKPHSEKMTALKAIIRLSESAITGYKVANDERIVGVKFNNLRIDPSTIEVTGETHEMEAVLRFAFFDVVVNGTLVQELDIKKLKKIFGDYPTDMIEYLRRILDNATLKKAIIMAAFGANIEDIELGVKSDLNIDSLVSAILLTKEENVSFEESLALAS